jgi:Protein of unknown function (DUF2510)
VTYVETAPAPAAGWYGDPGSEDHLRWWSGTAWTENITPNSSTRIAPEPMASPDPTPTPDVQPMSRRAALANERLAGADASSAVVSPVSAPTVTSPPVVAPPADPLPAISLSDDAPQQGWILGTDVASSSPYSGYGHSRNWSQVKATPSRWNTRYAWLIAFLPWFELLTGVLAALLVRNGIASIEVTLLLGILPLLAFIDSAIRDRRQLIDWGYERPASVWWLLLGPLVYLIARTVRLRAEAGRGAAPLWAFVINSITPVVAAMAAVVVFNDRILALLMY